MMKMSIRTRVNQALIAMLGCGACHAAIPPVPSQGGPAWNELTSAHFVVWTDSSPDDGRQLIRVMEHLRQIVFGVSVFNPTSNARAFVIALRHQREVRPFLPEQFAAVAYTPSYPLYQPFILLSVDGLDYDRRLTTHELTHVISYNALVTQPAWFAEGLAGYFETIHLDEDGSFNLGAPFDGWLQVLRGPAGLMPVTALFACTKAQCKDSQFYATAWALFAYLANHRPADLLRYVQRLTELDRESQAGAWAEVYPDLTPAKLDDTLASWIQVGDLTVHHYKVKLDNYTVKQRPLTDADVYAARALLRDRDSTQPVPAEVAAALAIDPTHVIAQMLRIMHDDTGAPEIARSLTAAHPNDWRAWWLLALAVRHGEEADAAIARVGALLVNDPAVLPKGTCPSAAPAGRATSNR
jgi:hypothetical protein